jgi:hypothetical protein
LDSDSGSDLSNIDEADRDQDSDFFPESI